MHSQIITYQLKNLSHDDYATMCVPDAQLIAQQPGLITKVWLASPETNTYGGMYTWRDRQSMEAFMQSDMVTSMADDPSFAGFTSRDFAVLEEPTRVTARILAIPA
jgi:hypothetical protein